MREETLAVLRSLAVLLPILGAGITAVVKLRQANSTVARRFAWAFVCALVLYASFEVGTAVRAAFNNAMKVRGMAKFVPRTTNATLAEASGGVFEWTGVEGHPGHAYVVDDESSAVFRLDYDAATRDYVRSQVWAITTPQEKKVDDLEGAALYQGALYVITSHSNTKEGVRKRSKREWLLRLEQSNGRMEVRAAAGDLRDEIEKILVAEGAGDWENKSGNVEMMNIEGFAIDASGLAYLGFRAPLVQGKAVILTAPIDSLFNGSPTWTKHFLQLSISEEGGDDPVRYRRYVGSVNHGIASLDYDTHSDRIFVLSDAEQREDWYKPALWSFPVADGGGEQVHPTLCDIGDSDVTSAGKPEALLIHPVRPSTWPWKVVEWVRGGSNGQLTLLYDVGDRPSLFRVLDRYDLCREIRLRH